MASTGRPLETDRVHVANSAQKAGIAAGKAAAEVVENAIKSRGSARVVFGSAPSQDQMIRTLGASPEIDWSRVQSLHLDEYRGIDEQHAAAFGRWLIDRLPKEAIVGLNRIQSHGDPRAEITRYSEKLTEAAIDLVCVGIGVNGHIAFNEPGHADFKDPSLVREISLTQASRQQQVDEGQFGTLEEVPTHALTMTVPAILRGANIICTVLGTHKAAAVAATLTGEITPELPASVLRTHPSPQIYLDSAAASELPGDFWSSVR